MIASLRDIARSVRSGLAVDVERVRGKEKITTPHRLVVMRVDSFVCG